MQKDKEEFIIMFETVSAFEITPKNFRLIEFFSINFELIHHILCIYILLWNLHIYFFILLT